MVRAAKSAKSVRSATSVRRAPQHSLVHRKVEDPTFESVHAEWRERLGSRAFAIDHGDGTFSIAFELGRGDALHHAYLDAEMSDLHAYFIPDGGGEHVSVTWKGWRGAGTTPARAIKLFAESPAKSTQR